MSEALVFAAAGLAEGVWFMAQLVMGSLLLVICLLAMLALWFRSAAGLVGCSLLWAAFTAFFRPWSCFTPFDAEAYDDPDVVDAAGTFQFVGVWWILTTALVLTAVVVAWRRWTPRLKNIVLVDFPALFCAISIPGIWLIGLIFPLLRQGVRLGSVEMFLLALLVSLVAAAVLVWRITRIQSLFRRGVPTQGQITNIRFWRDRGRVEFAYEFDGERWESWMPVHQTADVRALQPWQEVDLLVDPTRPRRAVIQHLFE